MNKVFLMGRLTRDPEQRFIPSGQSVVDLGLAVNRVWFDKNHEKQEEVAFIDITAWGKRGEVIHQRLKKGEPIFIEGRLQFDSWETKEGEKRSKLRVVMDNFEFIGGGQRGGGQASQDNLDPADFGVDAASAGGAEGQAGEGVPF